MIINTILRVRLRMTGAQTPPEAATFVDYNSHFHFGGGGELHLAPQGEERPAFRGAI